MQVTYSKGFALQSKDARIDRLAVELEQLPQVDCAVREYFADGLYAREITIPKGVALIGAIHKTHNFAIVSKGVLRVATDDGAKDVQAGEVIQIRPGQKNCVYAIEECVWTNFFANPDNERDSNKLVENLSESKATDLLGGSTNKQLAANRLAALEA